MTGLYHIAWARSLPSIATRGLVASGGSGIARQDSAYAEHSRGRLFATELDGVRFWYGIAENHANDRSDDPLREGFTPVVLRFPDVRRKEIDPVGSDDAGAYAFVLTRVRIPPAFIEVWTGGAWVPIRAWRRVQPRRAYDFEREDGQVLAFFKERSPLIPPGAR